MNTATHLIAKKFNINTPDAQFVLECWQERRNKLIGKKNRKKKGNRL